MEGVTIIASSWPGKEAVTTATIRNKVLSG